MPSYTTEDLQNALEAISDGMPIRTAAKTWVIPPTTLRARSHGRNVRPVFNQSRQRLSPDQESSLRDWVLLRASLGFAPRHQQLAHFAEKLLKAGGDDKPLGKHWTENFLRRNPEVKSLKAVPLDQIRKNGASEANIKLFFDMMAHPKILSIAPQFRYNMDETGLMEGTSYSGKVLTGREKKTECLSTPACRTWTTIVECINATGQCIDPLVIFKGKSVQKQWFPDDRSGMLGWHFEAQDNGFIDCSIAQGWLENCFIPQSGAGPGKETRLLVLDGHISHETDEFQYTCYYNNIHLLYLPAHASHVLQPLDVGVFSSLKQAYRMFLDDFIKRSAARAIGKPMFLILYQKARKKAFSSSNIVAGWRHTGLWPQSCRKALQNRFVVAEDPPQPAEAQARPRTPQIKPEHPENTSQASQPVFLTPKGHRQLRESMEKIGTRDPSTRALFRSVGKRLDHQNHKIELQQRQIDYLELEIETLRPPKRQKIHPNPNDRFVKIPALEATRERYQAVNPVDSVARQNQEVEFDHMCSQYLL